MYCNQCGEENRNDRKFCTNCGAQLRDYTKPKQNLIMPDDLIATNKAKKALKVWALVFTVLAVLFAVATVALLVVAFVEGFSLGSVYAKCALICFGVLIAVILLRLIVAIKQTKFN